MNLLKMVEPNPELLTKDRGAGSALTDVVSNKIGSNDLRFGHYDPEKTPATFFVISTTEE